MNIPSPVYATAACAALTATRLREAAQVQIVRAFCVQLSGGPEPSDEAVALFARLSVSELRLHRRLLAGVATPESARHDSGEGL